VKDRTVVIRLERRNLDAMLRALEHVRPFMSIDPAWELTGTQKQFARIRVVMAPAALELPLGARLGAKSQPAEVLLMQLGKVGRAKLGFEYWFTSLDAERADA